jgi:hypothetical protein
MNVENARKRQATQPASNDCDAIIHALLYHLADIDVTKNTVRGQHWLALTPEDKPDPVG